MNPPVAANSGVDNQICVDGTNEIAQHAVKKGETTLRTPSGAPMLGGSKTKLHQNSVSKKPWQLVQNGDLWSKVPTSVKAKNPKTIKLTKQKGHATQEMVDEGEVREADKEADHQSDRAADKGVVEEQQQLNWLGWKYAARLRAYARFMEKVHDFIIKVTK